MLAGIAVDFDTTKPIADVMVSARYSDWGFQDGSVVWDKQYVYSATTDSSGAFILRVPRRNLLLSVAHPAYITVEQWHSSDDQPVLKLKRANPTYVPLPQGILRIGVDASRPYGWVFARGDITFDPNEADIFPVIDTSSGKLEQITVTTGNAGGVRFITADQLGVETNLLTYTDEAPSTDYVSEAPIILDPGGRPGVYFVRTRDGQHYAKFLFDPASYTTIGSLQDGQQATWGLLLHYVYNPGGTRKLEFQ